MPPVKAFEKVGVEREGGGGRGEEMSFMSSKSLLLPRIFKETKRGRPRRTLLAQISKNDCENAVVLFPQKEN
jgi:hypothetical protein